MYEKLLKSITNVGSPKILVVGDFELDTYTYGDVLGISTEAPVPVLKAKKTEHSCGAAGAVVTNLAALGASCYCIGVIGEDQNGKVIKQKLKEFSADTKGIFCIKEWSTVSKRRLIGLAQHRHQQQLMQINEGQAEQIPELLNDKILDVFQELLKKVEVVCLQDNNISLLNNTICRQMIKLGIAAGKKVLVDPCSTSNFPKYSTATVMTPNRAEASLASGSEIRTAEDASEAASKLREKLQLEAVVITLDKEGAYVHTDTLSEMIPTRTRSVYDVTGAGDMFFATLAMTLSSGCDYTTAVQLANIASGIEVEKFGNASVTVEEILNEIIGLSYGKNGKIHSVDSLLKQLDRHRKQNDKIVFTNGCFDVLHRGHIDFLEFCKSHGDIVVLGLNSDNSVKAIKGPKRPIYNEYDRAAVLAALESVCYITIFDEPDPLNLIKQVRPDVLVKGRDWEHKGVIGREFVESYGGKVELAPIVEGKSSTITIEKIQSLKRKSNSPQEHIKEK